jgi:hypothetical protein
MRSVVSEDTNQLFLLASVSRKKSKTSMKKELGTTIAHTYSSHPHFNCTVELREVHEVSPAPVASNMNVSLKLRERTAASYHMHGSSRTRPR